MQRIASGLYQITTTAGESVRSFVPDPLPPNPSLDMGGLGQALKDRALLACGRLDGVAALEHGLARMASGFPLSSSLLREIRDHPE